MLMLRSVTEQGDISVAIPNEEAIEVDCLLEEPHAEALDVDAMYLNSETLENCLNVEGTPCSTGLYDQRDDCGILDVDAEKAGMQALKYEFMFQGSEENENLHISCNLSCDCSDYLLENSLDHQSNSEATFGNMEYAGQIQCMDSGVDEVEPDYISKTFTVASLIQTTAPDSTKVRSQDALHTAFCRNTPLEAQKWRNHELLFDEQKLTALDNVSDLMESAFLYSENEDEMILVPQNGMTASSFVSMPHSGALVSGPAKNELPYEDGQAAVSQGAHKVSGSTNVSVISSKRLRKPTRRYIEETSEIKPRCSYDRFKMSIICSEEKLIYARTERKNCWSGAVQLLYHDYPGRAHSLRGCRRNSSKKLENDRKGYISPSESAKFSCVQVSEKPYDGSDKAPARINKPRKHNRQWTLSEVVRLVDGVSQHGVGRWTEIKRLFFSTSAYRTAVDLKDKWRNLLRASVAGPTNRNLVESQKKQASAAVPQSILQRVRDLSIIYPYPRSRKPRITALPNIIPPGSVSKY
ncbi:uncharacterized protein LOC110039515 isoform X2 [Phalaenopsis equestris]|uniref:uncharacterized protein LOC110039515 isoform X2 n=1 Tax=Phalaenopsis equestris TaxID=78828 RepID=UPI0009E5359F|nr:uncharacterized protein LOC110039515 isoform X2 [Phalaenopsis equestris]